MRSLLFITAALCLAAAALAADPPVPTPAPSLDSPVKKKILHLRLLGDLDNTHIAKQLAESLSALERDGIEILILELNGNRWRSDVLADIVHAARSAGLAPAIGEPRCRWIVWLNDPLDGRVSGAAAALGALADRCYIAPKTDIVCEPGDDARALAPLSPAPAWEQIDQELQAVVWGRLRAHNADLLLAAALPTPRQPLWIIRDDRNGDHAATSRISASSPASEGAARGAPLVEAALGADPGQARLRMDAPSAVAVHLAAAQAKEFGQLLAAEHIAPRPAIHKDITSGYASAHKRLFDELALVDAARERLDKCLDEAEHTRGPDAVRKKPHAGSESFALAGDAIARLMSAERLFKDFPELLRLTPPGQTAIGAAEAKAGQEWNHALQLRRTSLTDLKNRAARLAN